MRNLDKENTDKDLVRAFAQFQAQVYVNYGKVMQPWAKLQADYFNQITVDGKCNTTAAEKCIYDVYTIFHHDPYDFRACLQNASCQMNYQKLTPA